MSSANSVTAKDFNDFAAWYSSRRHRLTGAPAKPSTLKTKRGALVTACKETGKSDPVSLANLLADRSEAEYLLARLAMRMTPGAMRSVVEALRQFGEYALQMKLTDRSCSLTRADVPPKNPPRPITVYSAEEMETLVGCARGKGLRWWAFVTLLADTGRRVGEALSLEWDWFRLSENPAYVELPQTKNGEPQYVPLPRRLREEVFSLPNIVALKQEERGYFGGEFARSPQVHPFPWHYTTVLGRWQRYCATIGVPDRGMHNMRHTVITRRIAAGVPIQAVAALAGHSSPATTLQRYSHATALDFLGYIDS